MQITGLQGRRRLLDRINYSMMAYEHMQNVRQIYAGSSQSLLHIHGMIHRHFWTLLMEYPLTEMPYH